jgi:D-glycero-D-manno-heptose 1,7-bisphosphate phosphatase
MIAAARARHRIDLGTAVLIGDSTKDILCARNAGVGLSILVRTGNGPLAESELADLNITPDHIADDLLAAVHWLVTPPVKHHDRQ